MGAVGLIRHGAVVIDFDAVFSGQSKYDCDFADVRGQEHAELALTIAAAGRHNVLVLGASDGFAKSELFAAILDRIQRFGVPQPLVQRG